MVAAGKQQQWQPGIAGCTAPAEEAHAAAAARQVASPGASRAAPLTCCQWLETGPPLMFTLAAKHSRLCSRILDSVGWTAASAMWAPFQRGTAGAAHSIKSLDCDCGMRHVDGRVLLHRRLKLLQTQHPQPHCSLCWQHWHCRHCCASSVLMSVIGILQMVCA